MGHAPPGTRRNPFFALILFQRLAGDPSGTDPRR
jgi:hypothetical protein